MVLSAAMLPPAGLPLSAVQEALTIFAPKHRLGERWAVPSRGKNRKERAMIQMKPRKLMHRRAFLKVSSTTAGAIAVNSQFSERAAGQSDDESPTFRRPKTILPVPTPSPQFQHVEPGVPDTQMTREAAGLLRDFSTPAFVSRLHRGLFRANEM